MALAISMNKFCLAEGIETKENFEILRGLGCPYGQGYWMSRPLVTSAFEQLLAEKKCYLQQFRQVA